MMSAVSDSSSASLLDLHPRRPCVYLDQWDRSNLNWLVRVLVWVGWMVLVLVEAAERSC